ncbi:TRAM domain-containing protein [Salinilacihabitans rarus]|uniref:TRAM domain-containing protein n=1 Tax=Salinilacihabitans rarus TaxID=2961596 RepID=UPI0020C8ED8C|nr:RNA-binding protein [Salinilacihabitans rarus]
MIGTGSLAIGLVVGVVAVAWALRRLRGRPSADERASARRHREAQARDPPVEIGDEFEAGVVDFSRHHSGERHAVCKVEGFVVFVEDVPDDLERADAIRAKVLSFNRGHTSATATFLGRA